MSFIFILPTVALLANDCPAKCHGGSHHEFLDSVSMFEREGSFQSSKKSARDVLFHNTLHSSHLIHIQHTKRIIENISILFLSICWIKQFFPAVEFGKKFQFQHD